MDTFFARNRLSAYIDGALPSAEARDVEAALARDPALREELERMRAAVELLRAEGIVEPPRDFAARVSARLDAEPMRVGWRLWVRQVRPEAVMLAAAALLVVVYVGQRQGEPRVVSTAPDTVTAGGTFGAGDEGGQPGDAAQAAGEPSAQRPADDETVEPQSAPPAGAAAPGGGGAPSSAVSAENDGVLGNEGGPPPPAKTQSLAQRLPKVRSKPSGLDVEPWQPEWEKEAANSGDAGAKQEVTFYSPAPFRYRVTANDARALKTLSAIAQDLGGELQDSRGRPVAAWSLEEGETRSVRVAVPAYNAAALAARLRELGDVETVQQKETLLTDPNANVPVQVELSY